MGVWLSCNTLRQLRDTPSSIGRFDMMGRSGNAPHFPDRQLRFHIPRVSRSREDAGAADADYNRSAHRSNTDFP
jgi:hypothetical protein